MALLDTFKKGAKRAGENLESYIGGLLGEDVSKLSEKERKDLRRQGLSAVFDAMAKGTTPTAGLQGVAANLGARLEAKRTAERQAAAEAMLPQVTGRLLGGAPAATMPAVAEDGLSGVNVQSRYRQDPAEAMRMMLGTQPGRDIAAGMPGLMEMAKEATGPKDYVYQNVSGYGLIAVNRKDPTDKFLVQGEVQRPAAGRDQIKILSAAEAKAFGLPATRVYKQNLTTGDVSAVEGSEATVPGALPEADERKYRTEKMGLINASNLIKNLQKTSSEIPAYKALVGEGRGRLESSYSLALSAIRTLQNSGVLNVGELPFLSKALSDPTSVRSIVTSPLQRRQLDAQINTVLGLIDQQRNVLDYTYGKTSEMSPDKTNDSLAASGYRRGRKPAAPGPDAVKRSEGYY